MSVGDRGAPLPDVLVLCYHGVSETWPAATAIRPSQLEQQLRFLVAQGYRGATFSRGLVAPPAPRTLIVTFDDAHRSVLELAHPIMSALGVPGTVFVPTDYVDGGGPLAWDGIAEWIGGPHEHELACMSRDELGTLQDAGWELGSHTCSHPRLTELDEDRLARELRESRELLTSWFGRECASLAYPYSDCDGRVAEAAWQAGYRLAATVAPHYEPPLPLLWPRIPVDSGDVPLRFRLRVSSTTRRLGVSPRTRPMLASGRTIGGALRRRLHASRRSGPG